MGAPVSLLVIENVVGEKMRQFAGSGATRRVHGDLGDAFAMFDAIRQHPQCQYLRFGDSLLARGAVDHHAGEIGHFGDPAFVLLAFDFDGKVHASPLESLFEDYTEFSYGASVWDCLMATGLQWLDACPMSHASIDLTLTHNF